MDVRFNHLHFASVFKSRIMINYGFRSRSSVDSKNVSNRAGVALGMAGPGIILSAGCVPGITAPKDLVSGTVIA